MNRQRTGTGKERSRGPGFSEIRRASGSSLKTSIMRKGDEKDKMLGLSHQREQNAGVHLPGGV
jgi:hypothetical protein